MPLGLTGFSEAHTRTTSTTSGELSTTASVLWILLTPFSRWKPFDPARNFPDLGPRFKAGEEIALAAIRNEKIKKAALAAKSRSAYAATAAAARTTKAPISSIGLEDEKEEDGEIKVLEKDKLDLDWSTVMKRTFEGYIRGERPNMYGEWIEW